MFSELEIFAWVCRILVLCYSISVLFAFFSENLLREFKTWVEKCLFLQDENLWLFVVATMDDDDDLWGPPFGTCLD